MRGKPLRLAAHKDMRGKQHAARPRGWTVIRMFWIDERKRHHEREAHTIPGCPIAPNHCDLAHQAVEADGVVRDRQVSLIGDAYTLDQREGSQRSYGLIETIAGEFRRQRLPELLSCLGEQE